VKEFCARAKSSIGRCNGPRGRGEMVTGCIVTLQVGDDESWVVTRVGGLIFGGTAPHPHPKSIARAHSLYIYIYI
jgi:hypothetical protein